MLSEKYGFYNNNEYPELRAITEAVKFAKQINQKVIIYSDYDNAKSLLNVTKKYKRNHVRHFKKHFVNFMEDNQEFYELNFIKGHSNNKYHNYIDRLCRTRKKDTYQVKKVYIDITN
jgi:ribonuclease HI